MLPPSIWSNLERETRLELATLALARRCSTTELLPLFQRNSILMIGESLSSERVRSPGVSPSPFWERAGVRNIVRPALNPHPNPLPEGEGTEERKLTTCATVMVAAEALTARWKYIHSSRRRNCR